MLNLTEHFIENWVARVSQQHPKPKMIQNILAESVRVQNGRDLYDEDGIIYRMLAIYWHPVLNIVIKIDRAQNKAVTVLSEKNYNDKKMVRRTKCN